MLGIHTIGWVLVDLSADGRRLLVLLVLVDIVIVHLMCLLKLLIWVFLQLVGLLECLLELGEELVDIGILLSQVVQALRDDPRILHQSGLTTLDDLPTVSLVKVEPGSLSWFIHLLS